MIDRLASLPIFPALVIAFALALPVVVGLFDRGY